MLRGLLVLVLALLAVSTPADAFCKRCKPLPIPHCADPTAKHRIRVKIDLAVQDGTVELITQSGPYHAPVADFDGKSILGIFLPRGEVFQGFFEEVIEGGILAGAMTGTTAEVSTGEIFAPGEYELLVFVDLAAGGPAGPQRGDIAAFDNTVCDPTGVSIRIPVGCEDATVTLTNRNFIIF